MLKPLFSLNLLTKFYIGRECLISQMMKMMGYQKLFSKAVDNLLEDYGKGKIKFFSEEDIRSHLFYECRKLMEEQGFDPPLKLFAEKKLGEGRSAKRVDLALGDDPDVTFIELKFEPEKGGTVFTTKNGPAKGSNGSSIEKDLERINEYARKGKHAYFFMIDEWGGHKKELEKHKERLEKEEIRLENAWKTIDVRGRKEMYYLLFEGKAPQS